MKKWILYFIAINISIDSILRAVKFPDADVFKDSTDESLRSIYQSKLSNKTQCQWVKNLYGDKPHSSSCSYMREIPATKIHPKGPQREPRTVCNTINDGCPGGYHKCNSEQCLKYYDGQPTPIYLLTDDSPCCADSETTHQWTIASDIDKARCMQSSRGVTNNGAYKGQWSWYAGSCYTRQEQYRSSYRETDLRVVGLSTTLQARSWLPSDTSNRPRRIVDSQQVRRAWLTTREQSKAVETVRDD